MSSLIEVFPFDMLYFGLDVLFPVVDSLDWIFSELNIWL